MIQKKNIQLKQLIFNSTNFKKKQEAKLVKNSVPKVKIID